MEDDKQDGIVELSTFRLRWVHAGSLVNNLPDRVKDAQCQVRCKVVSETRRRKERNGSLRTEGG